MQLHVLVSACNGCRCRWVSCRLAVLVCDRLRTRVGVWGEAGSAWSWFRFYACWRDCTRVRVAEKQGTRGRGSDRGACGFDCAQAEA